MHMYLFQTLSEIIEIKQKQKMKKVIKMVKTDLNVFLFKFILKHQEFTVTFEV